MTDGRHPGRTAPPVVGTRRAPWKGGGRPALSGRGGGRRRRDPARERRCGGWSRPVPLPSRCREPGRAGGYGFPARSMLINQDPAGKSRRGRRVRRKVAGIRGAVALRPRGAVSSGHFSPDPSCAIMNDQDRVGCRRGRPMPDPMGPDLIVPHLKVPNLAGYRSGRPLSSAVKGPAMHPAWLRKHGIKVDNRSRAAG